MKEKDTLRFILSLQSKRCRPREASAAVTAQMTEGSA